MVAQKLQESVAADYGSTCHLKLQFPAASSDGGVCTHQWFTADQQAGHTHNFPSTSWIVLASCNCCTLLSAYKSLFQLWPPPSRWTCLKWALTGQYCPESTVLWTYATRPTARRTQPHSAALHYHVYWLKSRIHRSTQHYPQDCISSTQMNKMQPLKRTIGLLQNLCAFL